MVGEKAHMSVVANAQDRKYVEFIKRPQEQSIKNSQKAGNPAKQITGGSFTSD
jgi:hypothetical protein